MAIVSVHVAATLARSVDHVFGIMGNGNAYFIDAIEKQPGATFTAMRHEAGAVVAADAHYRAGGGLAAATTTYGAGFTNTLTALAEAVQAHTPLILVVGDEPTPGPRPWDVDQIALAAAVGARTYTVGRADAAATTMIAVEHALAFRVPTVLAIPYDVARRDVGDVPGPDAVPAPQLPPPVAPDGDFGRERLRRIASRLAVAERPVLLAGRGAYLAGAADLLGELAAEVGALTMTTSLARGLFSDDEHDLGVAGGFGAAGAMDLVRNADMAVVFGASLNQFTMRFGELFAPHTDIVQIDIAAAATHPHVGSFVRADAALAAELLLSEVRALRGGVPEGGSGGGVTEGGSGGGVTEGGSGGGVTAGGSGGGEMDTGGRDVGPTTGGSSTTARGWRGTVDTAALRTYDPGTGMAPDGRLDPRSAAAAIAEMLPADRVVVSDGGHFIAWANMYWPVAEPTRMQMVGTAYQSIGQGFPSVPGAALARPDSTVVLTTGDGGGLMALADLEAAVRVAGGRGMAVVWNDAAYGAELNLYGLHGLAQDPMRIPDVDFAALAAAVGGEGVVVRTLTDLARLGSWAAERADQRRFLLLDLRISPHVIAPFQQEVIRINS